MKRRLPWIGAGVVVGLLLWPVVASVILCAALHSLRSLPLSVIPVAGWYYWRDYGDDPAVRHFLPLALVGAAMVAVVPPLLVVCWPESRRLRAARVGEQPPAPRRALSDLHGNADWMPIGQAKQVFPGPHPVYGGVVIGEAYRVDLDLKAIGRFDPADRTTWGMGGTAPLLIDPCTTDATHGTVFAGSGGYKTTAITIPTLTTWTGSAVVFDPPGQVGPMTEHVRAAMGHQVWTIGKGQHGVNVLDFIDTRSPTAEADVLDVLNWIGGPIGDKAGDNAAFAQAGRKLLACLLADMLWDPNLPRERKTLRELRARVSIPERLMKGRLQDIADDSRSPMARDFAGSLVDIVPRTFSGAYFHATGETDWLAIEAYAAMVSNADMNPSSITTDRVTVYLSVPMKDLEAAPALGRLLVAAFQSALRRAEGAVLTKRVLFLLDEARFLGRLPTLASMLTADRKYGATVVTLWQDETDLKDIWKGQAGVFAANSSWTMYAAVNDRPTSEQVSALAGKYTALARNEGLSSSTSTGTSGSGSRGRSDGLSEQPRELIKPDEVRTRLRADEAIVFRRGAPPLRCGRAIYFRRPDMMAQIDADRLRAAAE